MFRLFLQKSTVAEAAGVMCYFSLLLGIMLLGNWEDTVTFQLRK